MLDVVARVSILTSQAQAAGRSGFCRFFANDRLYRSRIGEKAEIEATKCCELRMIFIERLHSSVVRGPLSVVGKRLCRPIGFRYAVSELPVFKLPDFGGRFAAIFACWSRSHRSFNSQLATGQLTTRY
jgi:hypothetical protein